MSRYVVMLSLALFVGCKQATAPAPTGPAAGSGWEVRYDAVFALAHRGSDKFLDPVVQDLVKEMLDEEQQMHNFRSTLKDGKETINPQAARMAVLGAINAVTEYHAKKPSANLSELKPAIEKLTKGQNQVIAKEARTLLESMAAPAASPAK
jgi:hypothetical protein